MNTIIQMHVSYRGFVIFFLALALTAVSASLTASAQPVAQPQAFHISAGSLDAALHEFGTQSGLRLDYDPAVVQGFTVSGYSGTAPAPTVLTDLLAGTKLTYQFTGARTVVIKRSPRGPAPIGQPVQKPKKAANLGTIKVTGSRIKRAGYDTLEAISVTRAQEIENRGYSNALQVLQATPGFGVPGSSPLGTQGRLGIGQSFANYFGLGSQRTLTLVNGRRFVSSNSPAASLGGGGVAPGSQVDLNLIPVGLIKRVETVAIGGAPVYGADAIAGTVNIILKDHFQGIEATVQHGVSDRGDARNSLFGLLMGGNFGGGRGNAVISVEHTHQDSLELSDRGGFIEPLPNPEDTGPNDGIPATMFVPNTHVDAFTAGGLPYDGSVLNLPGVHVPGVYPNGNYLFNAAGQPLQFGANGKLAPIGFGKLARVVPLGGGITLPLYSSGGGGLDAARYEDLLAKINRTLINGTAHWDVTPDLRVFASTWYAHTESVSPIELNSFIAPGIANSPTLTFSVDNPFLSKHDRKVIQANGLTSFNLARALNDIVSRAPPKSDNSLYRVVAGMEGRFPAFGNSWSWNASYNYGRNRATTTLGFVNPDRLLLAADAVRNASGDIVCASGGDCVPINLFGENAFSAAAAEYVLDRGAAIATNTMKDFVGNVSGPLPFGIAEDAPVKFNLGYEHRIESAAFEPDAVYKAGNRVDALPGFTAVEGAYTTNEIYAETLVPVVSNADQVSWLKTLSFDLAGRNVDNSVAGSDVTWSAGGRIAPRFSGAANGLLFRGVYMQAIRAPSIRELFLPTAGTSAFITDPCDARHYKSGPVPAVRSANCAAALSAAAGAPTPANFHSTTGGISVNGISSGNPDLESETADSWSFGVVYQPVEFPRFRFSADWSHVSLTNGIALLAIDDILRACYDSTTYPNPACTRFSRLSQAQASSPRTAGDIATGFRQGYINTSSLEFSGLIVSAQYSPALPGDAGLLNLKGTVFHRNRQDVINFSGQPAVEEAGTIGFPEYNVKFDLGYSWHGFDTEWQVRWTSPVVIDNTVTIEDYPDYTIPSYTLVNATFGYQLSDRLHLQFVINNVFDRGVPRPVAWTRFAFHPYDAIGRRYLLRITMNAF